MGLGKYLDLVDLIICISLTTDVYIHTIKMIISQFRIEMNCPVFYFDSILYIYISTVYFPGLVVALKTWHLF